MGEKKGKKRLESKKPKTFVEYIIFGIERLDFKPRTFVEYIIFGLERLDFKPLKCTKTAWSILSSSELSS